MAKPKYFMVAEFGKTPDGKPSVKFKLFRGLSCANCVVGPCDTAEEAEEELNRKFEAGDLVIKTDRRKNNNK